MPQYKDQGFNMDPHSSDFLEEYPLPMVTSMNMHQYMAQLNRKIERLNQMDARWERMERDRMSRWGYGY